MRYRPSLVEVAQTNLEVRSTRIADEGWVVSPVGYLDRKVLLPADNGVIAEVQIWQREIYTSKEGKGTKLYTERRNPDTSPTPAVNIVLEERALYAGVLPSLGVDGPKLAGISKAPNLAENRSINASADPRSAAVSLTSKPSTDIQSPPGSKIASASPRAASNRTAGRSSQLVKNVSGTSDTSTLNVSTARAEFNKFGDFDFDINGQNFRVAEILDDLDADNNAADIINICNPKGTP